MKRITIVFKSGATQEFEVDGIKVTHNSFGELMNIECQPPTKKGPLYICLDDVAGVFSEEIE